MYQIGVEVAAGKSKRSILQTLCEESEVVKGRNYRCSRDSTDRIMLEVFQHPAHERSGKHRETVKGGAAEERYHVS